MVDILRGKQKQRTVVGLYVFFCSNNFFLRKSLLLEMTTMSKNGQFKSHWKIMLPINYTI